MHIFLLNFFFSSRVWKKEGEGWTQTWIACHLNLSFQGIPERGSLIKKIIINNNYIVQAFLIIIIYIHLFGCAVFPLVTAAATIYVVGIGGALNDCSGGNCEHWDHCVHAGRAHFPRQQRTRSKRWARRRGRGLYILFFSSLKFPILSLSRFCHPFHPNLQLVFHLFLPWWLSVIFSFHIFLACCRRTESCGHLDLRLGLAVAGGIPDQFRKSSYWDQLWLFLDPQGDMGGGGDGARVSKEVRVKRGEEGRKKGENMSS